MSDPIRDFFREYGAVPANDRGPDWGRATTDALLVHLRSLAAGRRTESAASNHRRIAPLLGNLTAVAAELWERVKVLVDGCAADGTDWPGRNECGRILAGLAQAADVLRMEAK